MYTQFIFPSEGRLWTEPGNDKISSVTNLLIIWLSTNRQKPKFSKENINEWFAALLDKNQGKR